jgi:hypothetical protein
VLTSWLMKEGAALLLGALGKWLLDAFNGHKQRQALEDLGRAEAQRDQERERAAATQRELEAQKNAPRTADDAIARLEDGSA